MISYGNCISLSDLLHSVWWSLGPSKVAPDGLISFFIMAEYYSIVYVHHIFFTHSSVDGHLGCFRVLAVVNSAAVDTGVHEFFQIMVFSRYMPNSGIAGSYGNSICNFFCNFFPILFSKMPVPIYTSTNSIRGFPFHYTVSSIYCL